MKISRRIGRGRLAVLTLLVALGLGLAVLSPSTSAARPDRPHSGWAHDCTSDLLLDHAQPRRIRYLIWCGTEIGRVAFSLHPPKAAPFRHFAPTLAAAGAGAAGPFHCARHGPTLRCQGRKRGPLVLRGWVGVPAHTRCESPLTLRLPFEILHATPDGCSVHRRQPKFSLGYMKRFRHEFGLDPDLAGHPAAIARRIRGLVAAWRRGNPVARWTMDNLGLPLRARDQRELDYRSAYIDHNAGALERWVPDHAAATYAGYDVDHAHGGIFYIGFVGDQQAQIAAFEREAGAIAPGRIRPFPVQPIHSERELQTLEEEVTEDRALWKLINSVGLAVLANKVEVGTQHVAQVKQLLTARFGPNAPFEVVFEPPGELL